ncbi:MAG: hypothetical protein ABI669_02800 [Usitatibacter sp.]
MPTRRQFIKVGIAGAAVFATVRWLDRSEAAPATNYRFFDAQAIVMAAALVPVVLAGALPEEPRARAIAIREVVEAFDRAISALSPAVQKEVDQLFSVFRFGPSRLAFAGLWEPMEEAPVEEVAAFLTRWRTSRFEIQRAGYQALTQLIQASWYDNTTSWAAIGYPGPPRLP